MFEMRQLTTRFYLKYILKKNLVQKLALFRITNKICKINPILNGRKTVIYTNKKLPHFSNIFRLILNSFYLKYILKKILVQKLALFRITNKICKINPILNGRKTVTYTNKKLPHFLNIFRLILNSFYLKYILKKVKVQKLLLLRVTKMAKLTQF